MKIKEIMNSRVITIDADTYLDHAARLMNIHNVGILPVMRNNRVLGVVTDRDIVVRALARGWNCHLTQAQLVMSENVVWCFEDASVDAAARLMANKQVHRLLVFGRDLCLKGIISLDDLAVALRDEKVVGRVLRDVSSPGVAYHSIL